MGFYFYIGFIWLAVPLALLFVAIRYRKSLISGFAVLVIASYVLSYWLGSQDESWQASLGLAILGPIGIILILVDFFTAFPKILIFCLAIAVLSYWITRRVLKQSNFNAFTALVWLALFTITTMASAEVFIEVTMRQAASKQFQETSFKRQSAVAMFANTFRQFRNSNGRLDHDGTSYIWSFSEMKWVKDCSSGQCRIERNQK